MQCEELRSVLVSTKTQNVTGAAKRYVTLYYGFIQLVNLALLITLHF